MKCTVEAVSEKLCWKQHFQFLNVASTSFSEEMLLKALMSNPLEMAMRNTVRSPSVPQNMLFSSTFMILVVEENDHLRTNKNLSAVRAQLVSQTKQSQSQAPSEPRTSLKEKASLLDIPDIFSC